MNEVSNDLQVTSQSFSIKVITNSEKNFYLRKIQSDATFKGAYIRSLTMTLYNNQISDKNSRFKICKEALMTTPVVIYTRKDFYLLDSFNEKIEIFKAAGLIDYWNFKNIDKKHLNYEETTNRKVLNLHHLFGCFQVLISGLIFSLIAFILELNILVIVKLQFHLLLL